jgi:uncharacterized protein YcnI
VRRAGALVVAAGIWLVLLAGPAWAHPGIEDPYVPAGVVTTVALGVPSEQPSPMVEIDVTLPPDFTLRHVDSIPGWEETTSPGGLRYFDGNVPQGGYAQFTFSGVFSVKKVEEVPVITRAADGTTVDWDQSPTAPRPAAIVFPGYPVGSAPVPGVVLPLGTTGGGWGPLVWGLALLVLAGGVVVGVAASRGRRRRRPGRPRVLVLEVAGGAEAAPAGASADPEAAEAPAEAAVD